QTGWELGQRLFFGRPAGQFSERCGPAVALLFAVVSGRADDRSGHGPDPTLGTISRNQFRKSAGAADPGGDGLWCQLVLSAPRTDLRAISRIAVYHCRGLQRSRLSSIDLDFSAAKNYSR